VELFDTIKKKWPNFVKYVLPKLSTVFQFLVLQLINDTKQEDRSVFLISNTHLFFHPQASVRILVSQKALYLSLCIQNVCVNSIYGIFKSMLCSVNWRTCDQNMLKKDIQSPLFALVILIRYYPLLHTLI
jgi:hypothetical protein